MTYDVCDHVSGSPAAMAQDCAQWLCGLALASSGRFAVCCSGGSTPRAMYQRLAAPDIASRFPWDRVHWFWGDERFVPPGHPDSNYGMVEAALLLRVPAPRANIHPIPTTGLSPEDAAAAYEGTLKSYLGREALTPKDPIFDVLLLGLGEDGHTASLFPGSQAIDEAALWAVAVNAHRHEPRITLTLPVLGNARETAFLVTGDNKRGVVKRVRAGDSTLPAARVAPAGSMHWFMDLAARPDGDDHS